MFFVEVAFYYFVTVGMLIKIHVMKSVQIGQEIRNELRRQGKTNTWLAQKIHVNSRTVNKIFLKNDIDTSQLMIISFALGVDFFKLYSSMFEDYYNQ